jgi:hypothetical protein
LKLTASTLVVVTAVLAASAQGQSLATIYVSAPQVRIVCGDMMQLSAVGRDGNGNLLSVNFQWSSNNTSVIQVDSNGNVTASGLGIADVTAASGNRSGVIRLQVLPQQVIVTPADAIVNYGSQQQYTAVALDIAGQPIPSATFAWHVLVAGGAFDSGTVPVTSGGLVNANTLGYYVVRASLVYSSNTDQFEREFDGSTSLTIVPNDYNVTALASSSISYPSFHLIGKRSVIATNDAGQVAFSGSLDGLSAGLLLWQNQSLSLLASAGTPGVTPGSVFYDFDNVSIDSQGNVLATANVIGTGPNIVLVNANGVQVVVPDRLAADLVQDVGVQSTTRFSLSETGDVAFRGNFHYPNSTDNYSGLLRASGGNLTLEVSSKDPLPGLTGTVSFDDQYGLDANGTLYFSANASSARAVYQKPFLSDPVKVLALGDSLGGSNIASLWQVVLNASDLVLSGNLVNGQQFLARYPGGDITSPPKLMLTTGYINQLLAVNAKGGIVLLADTGAGYGLYVWTGGDTPPQLILPRFSPSPTGEPVADFYSAAIDAAGNVYATIRLVDTPWMLVRANATPQMMATNGTVVGGQANLDLFPQPVLGDRIGPMHVLAGGNQASIFQANQQGLVPAVVVGDRLPGGSTFTGNNSARKSPSGDLYVVSDTGLFHLANAADTLTASFPLPMSDGVLMYSPGNISVNDRNQVSMLGGTDHSHQRLTLFDGSTFQAIAYIFGAPPYTTPSPGGGTFANFNDQAIDDSGQVMVIANVAGGPGGMFLFDGNAWQSVCVLNSCQLGGENITVIQNLRVSNNQFCAEFTTAVGNYRIDCWQGGTWTNILKRGDIVSDGTGINGIGAFDINRNGDVAAVLYTGLNGPSIFVKTAAGGIATVLSPIFPTPDGSYLLGIYAVDLRDDGRVFFIGQDYLGRMIAYEADPHS